MALKPWYILSPQTNNLSALKGPPLFPKVLVRRLARLIKKIFTIHFLGKLYHVSGKNCPVSLSFISHRYGRKKFTFNGFRGFLKVWTTGPIWLTPKEPGFIKSLFENGCFMVITPHKDVKPFYFLGGAPPGQGVKFMIWTQAWPLRNEIQGLQLGFPILLF